MSDTLEESGLPADAPAYARLFLALWPGADEHAALVRYLGQWSWPGGASPVRHERLHLTLHFIGPLDRQRLDAVGAALEVPVEPFDLPLTRSEIWPRGLVVLRAAQPPAQLLRLHARLARALQAIDLPLERRRFRPHVTLARRAATVLPPPDMPPLSWRIDGYALVESLPGSGGYPIRRRYG